MFNVLLCVCTRHDWALVIIAAVVCVSATLAAFYLYSKVPSSPLWRRWTWLGMSGLVAGSGIWTTHFVAMLAFKTGLPTGYAPMPTLASLIVAVLGAGAGFAVASTGASLSGKSVKALLGGAIVGISATGMHYIGMLGYRTPGVLQWSISYVVASALIGSLCSAAALWVARPGGTVKQQVQGAGWLSLAIVGMHFTGMTAVTIWPDARIAVPASLMSNAMMAAASVAATTLIILTAVAGAGFDTASRNTALKRLREALDVMPEGLAFYDPQDRLVAWNAQYEDLCQAGGATPAVGMLFTELLQVNIVNGAYPDAAGREAEWLEERVAARQSETPSVLQRTSCGRWLRITDRRTSDGGTVSCSVDVTDMKQAEIAMTEARDRAETLARRADAAEAIAGLGHWQVDAGTDEVTWSTQMYQIYGLDAGAPLSLDAILAMTHEDDAETTARRLAAIFAGQEIEANYTIRIVRSAGDVRVLAVTSRAQTGPDDQIRAVIGTVVDVTEQRLAQAAIAASEERFRGLADNAPDMITESTLGGIITYVSPACLAITGFTPEELVGKSSFSLMEPEDADQVRMMCKAAFASNGEVSAVRLEFRARHKNGDTLWLECKPTLARDPVTGHFIGLNDVVRDVTPRKTLERQLRAAREEAEIAAAVKSEFLANMSHELRTPLTSIIGFTGLAVRQSGLPDLARTYIERVGDASRALLSTVNDILDFSKLEAGQVSIQPQPVCLTKLAASTIDLVTPQAGAKDLDLVHDRAGTDDDLVIMIDPDRIRQVLLNLLSNAVKFTTQGQITLRTRYDRNTALLTMEVSDTGGGIPLDKQGCLFKRFSQVDGSLTRVQGGTGLGLAICKGLAEAMGGQIEFESAEGVGSRFWFTIPAPEALLVEPSVDEPGPSSSPYPGIRVLVADDHPTNRQLAKLLLAGIGAEVTEAEDGEAAAEIASRWPFDVILMDLRMPRLDGVGALRRIRDAFGPNDITPILAFTADAASETAVTALGFDGVVSKPIDSTALIAAITLAVTSASGPLCEVNAHAV